MTPDDGCGEARVYVSYQVVGLVGKFVDVLGDNSNERGRGGCEIF